MSSENKRRTPHPIRWKYDIFIISTDKHRVYKVSERPTGSQAEVLFSSTNFI